LAPAVAYQSSPLAYQSSPLAYNSYASPGNFHLYLNLHIFLVKFVHKKKLFPKKENSGFKNKNLKIFVHSLNAIGEF
jgi:hypothetical protein